MRKVAEWAALVAAVVALVVGPPVVIATSAAPTWLRIVCGMVWGAALVCLAFLFALESMTHRR